jgi:ABC-type nitrate/sulfonate/bicarbonate transport system substrate-binding protein/outer membrane protein OmpA-like peptidoglycan-associated protein
MKTPLVTFLLLVASFSIGAASDVKNIPMDQLLKSQVGTVRNNDTTNVPYISWGGDMATLHANGDANLTKNGSIFDKLGLKINLTRQDIFSEQVKNFMSGKSPYLRGTIGMINQASDVLSKDNRTKPVIIYQMTWSAGGDALVVKNNIRSVKDLKGKTIAIQAYGPHTDYLIRILNDAGLSLKDVNIKWTKDLTATDSSPMESFYDSSIDAAFVIIPDALALTSGGNVGTGSEDSVKGAKILMSTKTASRVIADVYAVRSDYLKSNRPKVENFVRGLMQGEEALSALVKNKNSKSAQYNRMIKASAKALLDSEQAVADAEGMFLDAEFVGFDGNVKFFSNQNNPRRMSVLNSEAQKGLAQLGLVAGNTKIADAKWDYGYLKAGLSNTQESEAPRFDSDQVASVVNKRQQQGSLAEGELFSFEVFFKPNQSSFSADLYKDAFDKVINLASTYAGAVITIEGHSDPMGYLRKKKTNVAEVVLGRVKQSARNLSLGRSQAVRDSVIQFAQQQNILLDPSQFAIIGHGIAMPNTGICGADPCAPKTEQEWRSNMRVVFRIIQIEAEEAAFNPL